MSDEAAEDPGAEPAVDVAECMNHWSINIAMGPSAVHAEFVEVYVILENGAEQAKIRAEFVDDVRGDA